MSAVAVGVTRRAKLGRLIHLAISSFISLAKVPGPNQLPITRKVAALAFPFSGNRAEVAVIEAFPVRGNASIDNADDEVGPEVGLLKERADIVVGGFEAEERRGAGGMEGAELLRDEREDVGEGREVVGLDVGEVGGEAVEDGVVCVEDLGWLRGGGSGGGGEGVEGGLVPVVVGGEDGGLCAVVDADDEGAVF